MCAAQEAMDRLKQGNQRYVSGLTTNGSVSLRRRVELADGQAPFAIVLGCSDSRVPVELVFDQGLGELFVIRVAGNVVTPSQLGSVEFAASMFGCALVVVLGHSRCGAVEATLQAIREPSENGSPNLRAIVDRIRPAVCSLMDTSSQIDPGRLMPHAIRANIRASVDQLTHGSAVLEHLISTRQLMVVGAEYDLESGEVDFFEGVPT